MRWRSLLGVLRRHWVIAVVLFLGTVLRVAAWLAYQPALLYGDSFRYLDNVGVHDPNGLHPIGYDLFVLQPVLSVGGLGLVVAVQHLAMLGSALAIYALAVRLGAARWLAALAATPLLLDAYQVQIEQMIMSDTWLQVLLVAVLWVLLGAPVPRPRRAALAGLLLGIAVVFRLVALPLVVPAVCYLVIAGGAWRGWRSWRAWRTVLARSVTLVAAFAVVVGGYAGYFYAQTGKVGLSPSSGNVLYGRAAVVADCERLDLPQRLQPACPDEPLGERLGIDKYAHIGANPQWRAKFPPGTDLTRIQQDFGLAVIGQQPLDVAGAVVKDFLKGFRPLKTDAPGDVSVGRWHFQPTYQFYDHEDRTREYVQRYSGRQPSEVPPLAEALRWYQLSIGFTPGTLLGLLGLVALFAGLGVTRNARASGLRAAALLPVGLALVQLLASAAFEFSWRYQLPGLVLLPLAGVLGITALRRRPTASDRASAPSAPDRERLEPAPT